MEGCCVLIPTSLHLAIFTLTPHFLSASTKCVGRVRSGVTVEMMTKTVPSSVPDLQCRKMKSESEVAQLCPTLSDPMDCSPPGSSILGIFQARVLEWGAIAISSRLYNLLVYNCS